MRKQITIALSCLMSLGLSSVGYAQNKSSELRNLDQQGEIVMTQAELSSFLDMLAKYKKQQLEAQRSQPLMEEKDESSGISQQGVSSGMHQQVLNDINRLNQRIDNLMLVLMNQNQGGQRINYVPQSSQAPTTVVVPSAGQSGSNTFVLSNPPAPSAPSVAPAPVVVAPASDEDGLEEQKATQMEVQKLQIQMSTLQDQIKSYEVLAKSNPGQFDQEVNDLKRKIDQLNAQLEGKQMAQERLLQENEAFRKMHQAALANPLMELFNGQKPNIYFANNSSELSAGDLTNLQQLAQLVVQRAQSGKPVLVGLKAYASKVGTVAYNNKLALRRAQAVKKALESYGLSPQQIFVLDHGVDAGTYEEHARRVEFSLLKEYN